MEDIFQEDNEIAARYLDKIQFEKPSVKLLKVANCDISLIVKALQLFKPKSIKIESFAGDIKEILPHLPIQVSFFNIKFLMSDG